jgi:hypothetical protein
VYVKKCHDQRRSNPARRRHDPQTVVFEENINKMAKELKAIGIITSSKLQPRIYVSDEESKVHTSYFVHNFWPMAFALTHAFVPLLENNNNTFVF